MQFEHERKHSTYALRILKIVSYVVSAIQHMTRNSDSIHTQCGRWIHRMCY